VPNVDDVALECRWYRILLIVLLIILIVKFAKKTGGGNPTMVTVPTAGAFSVHKLALVNQT